MIEGFVNANREAIVPLSLRGPEGQTREVNAVIDTGYSGALTLPPALVAELETVADAGYQPHIRRIGEEKLDQSGEKTHPARRWVVERTLGWLSKCRAILVRYDKKPTNYLGLLQLACALIWYRRQCDLPPEN